MAEAPAQTIPETKKDLIEKAKGLPPTESFSLRPRTFDEAFRFANLIAESDLVPKEFRGKPANVLVAVQLGMELDVPPMQALQNIAVINGRPTIWGDLLPALVYKSGLCEQFDEEGDAAEARCTVKRKGFPAITRTFTMEEAKKIRYVQWDGNQKKELTLADKETYKSYGKRMLQMRARAYAIRDAFADVLKGCAVREEVDDFEVARDVTPEPEPMKMPQPTKENTDAGGSENAGANEKGSTQVSGADQDGKPENPTVAETSPTGAREKPEAPSASAPIATETTEPGAATKSESDKPKEKTKKEIALDTIAGFTHETFPEPAWMNQFMKGLKGAEQLEITNAFNEKKKELGIR